VLDLPQAVHRLSGQPAQLFGLQGRGLLKQGYAADLMLFDPKTVARGPKRRAHDLPAGAARLTTSAVGLHGVWINGAQVTDANGFCAGPKSRPGEVLRSFAAWAVVRFFYLRQRRAGGAPLQFNIDTRRPADDEAEPVIVFRTASVSLAHRHERARRSRSGRA